MSEPLSPEREAEIRNRRLDEVTAGPWLVSDDQDGRPVIYVEQTTPAGTVCASVLLTADWASEADVQFVCSARTSVPELLSELDRVRAALDDARADALREAMARLNGVAESASERKQLGLNAAVGVLLDMVTGRDKTAGSTS